MTGSDISSCVLSTRGNVERIMSGVRTGVVFSARPYAPFSPATTMVRTEPTYIGSVIRCVWLLPLPVLNGPIKRTTGLKRFALVSAGFNVSSPPVLNSEL